MIDSPLLRSLLLAALCCMTALKSVAAEDATAAVSCGTSLGYLMPALAAASAVPSATRPKSQLSDDVPVTSDGFDADLLNGYSVFTGHVDVHMGDRELQADQITHDNKLNTMNAVGQVRFRNPIVLVQGDAGRYADDGALFTHAQFQFLQQPGYGTAEQLAWAPDNVIDVRNVVYTSCPPPQADWRLRAKELRLDTAAGQGVGRDARLEVAGIPILYLPWISFPLSDARKSGFLFPEFSTSSPNGVTVATPWYWNIAPNQDATLTPTVYALRGLDMGVQYRYLSQSDSGTINANLLPDDQRFAEANRSYVRVLNRLLLPANSRLEVDYENVSDTQYFEDFTQGTESTSTPFLPRSLLLSHRDDIWNLRAQLQSFQTLDTVNLVEYQRPYMELPRITAAGLWSPQAWPLLNLSLDSEAVNFTRSCDEIIIMESQTPGATDTGNAPATTGTAGSGTSSNQLAVPCSAVSANPKSALIVDPQFPLSATVSGWRLNARPQVGLDVSGAGYFFRPSVAWDVTQYELRDDTGADRSVSRSLPIVDVDSGLQFERVTGSTSGRSVTFEPRVMYVYIPYRDQSQFPIFDSATPDLNTFELFRPNRFVGIDRIGDSNSLTVGTTSQWFNNVNGARYLSATLAQAFYLQQPLVTSPDQILQPHTTSSTIAEANLTAYRHWNLQADVASSPSRNRIEQAQMMLQYLANNKSVANLGYLYRYGVLQQVDGSAAWPVSRHWDVYARATYSLFSSPGTSSTVTAGSNSSPVGAPTAGAPTALSPSLATPAARPGSIEDFVGFQYRGSCWSVRAVAQRSISTRTGQTDTGVSLQVELTGLSNVRNGGVGTGSGVNTFLEQSIRGYSASAPNRSN